MTRAFTISATLGAWLLASSTSPAYEPELTPATETHYASPQSAAIGLTSYFDDVEQVDDEVKQPHVDYERPACGCETSCACEPSCDCQQGCCNGYCDASSGWGNCLGDCCLGDPCTLQGYLQPCCDRTYTYGGWISAGYYTDNDRFSFDRNDLASFWDNPHDVNLDQLWFYTEKVAAADACSADWGYRFDMMYGVDAQKTQAFGNDDNVWDVSLDHGRYGWAMPQLYGEVAYGDLSVKFGHFYTLVGYEVVPKTGNFFYSHSYTMFNSEPFTHTGVLGTYSASDDLTLYGGWTLGWDTGFDQFGDGSNFLGGFGAQVTDDIAYTYICTAGDLGWRGDGYSHSNVVDVTLSNNWQYVLQSDYLNTNRLVQNNAEDESVGIVNYLFYTMNDCWKLGGRAEWWKSNHLTGEMTSYYAITGGVNYKPHANVVIRPEVKYNWTPSEDAVDNVVNEDFNQFLFGIDAIVTY